MQNGDDWRNAVFTVFWTYHAVAVARNAIDEDAVAQVRQASCHVAAGRALEQEGVQVGHCAAWVVRRIVSVGPRCGSSFCDSRPRRAEHATDEARAAA